MSSCWEATYDAVRPYSAFAGGLVFGCGWWIFGDALTYRLALLHLPFSPLWLLPGLVATLAIILMNTVSPQDVSSDTYGDEAATCRSRGVLVLSYALSLGAICGSVALLLVEKKAKEEEGGTGDLWMGASSVIQVCLICAAGLLTWVFHPSNDSGYSYMYI